MSRSLITKWEDLATAHHEGDRLSIYIEDAAGKIKILDCRISFIYREGEPDFDDEVVRWKGFLAQATTNDNND